MSDLRGTVEASLASSMAARSESSPERDTPLAVRDLVVGYGSRVVLRGVDLDLYRGEVLGVLGPNGAGKTTLIRRMAGLLPSKAGTVCVDGGDPASSRAARARIGYMAEAPPLYPEDNVLRYVCFRAALQGVPRRERRSAAREALDRAGALGLQTAIIGRLSKGQRQRVALAAAIVHRPDVVLLDEPGDGLDPRQTVALRKLLCALSRESAVLVSTHLLAEAQQTCDRVVILDQGSLVLASSGNDEPSVRLRVNVEGPDLITLRAVLAGVNGVTAVDDDAVCTVTSPDVAGDIAAAVRTQGWKLRELAAATDDLERTYLRVAQGEQR
jgi:ABC-2 type transport system ATP-binding protein